MLKVNKNQVINNLKTMIKEESNITKKKQVNNFLRVVKKSNLDNYIVRVSSNGYYNIGDIGECLMLQYLGIDKEDNNHEIKTMVKNSPNILVNDNVKVVYLLILSQDSKKDKVKNGLYKVNAEEVLNIKITKSLLNTLNLEKIANFKELASPLTKKIVVRKLIEKNINVKDFNRIIKLLTLETSEANRKVMELVL